MYKHLILGGSEGIGFSYAALQAKKGHSLKLVARCEDKLEAARLQLLDCGASQVEIVCGDLTNPGFLSSFLSEQCGFDTILAGGPSPKCITLSKALSSSEDEQLIVHNYRAAISYPLRIIDWALNLGLAPWGRLYILGSSESKKAMLTSPFFPSASFRRVIDELVEEYFELFKENKKNVQVWRPDVVVTPLSIRYACYKASKEVSASEAKQVLEGLFPHSTVLTSDEYIQKELIRGGEWNITKKGIGSG